MQDEDFYVSFRKGYSLFFHSLVSSVIAKNEIDFLNRGREKGKGREREERKKRGDNDASEGEAGGGGDDELISILGQ